MLDKNIQTAVHAQQRATDEFTRLMLALLYKANRLPKRQGLKKVTENKLEVKVGDRPAYVAKSNTKGELTESTGSLSATQLKAIQAYIGGDVGQKFENAPEVEFRINGKPLFHLKDGVVLQNDLPAEIKEMAKQQKLFPVEEKNPPILVSLNGETQDTPLPKIWHSAKGMPSQAMGEDAGEPPSKGGKLKENINTLELFEKASNVMTMKGVQSDHDPDIKKWSDGTYQMQQIGDRQFSISRQGTQILAYPGNNSQFDVQSDKVPEALEHFADIEKQMTNAIAQQVSQSKTKELQRTPYRQTAPGLDL